MRTGVRVWMSMRRAARRAGVAAAAVGVVLLAGGCQLIGFGGALVESYKRNSTREVKGEYGGLKGKSFAVVVNADRVIQSDYPNIVPRLASGVSERLAAEVDASGFVPAAALLSWQFNNPRWTTMPPSELAAELGVQRLVVVELQEYRLHEPGNQYLWEGVAAGTVSVIEADSALPDEPVFERFVRVGFPDAQGFGPRDLGEDLVHSTLAKRFVDRASWLFYDHQEPYYPDY